jgi:4-amino-4-deoxychorismate lyase
VNTTLINGQFENKISVQDRGLQYGDGVFRTLVCNRGSIPHFAKHYQKLKQDAKAIHISIPRSPEILSDIKKLCSKVDIKIIKIIITRGESTRGYDYSKIMTPNVIIQSFDYDQKRFIKNQTGVSVETASVLLDKNSISEIKHLNRLINILALAGKPKSIHDRIMLDQKQNIIEGAYHCIFFKKGNKFIIPSLNQFGLQGVSRHPT